jgi:hypothetical protein
MNQEKLDSIRDARARGEILTLVRRTHRAQASRMDHVELWHMLRGLGIDVGEDDVLTFLQDLAGAGLIEFQEEKDRRNNRVTITHIQLCNRGLRVLEGRVVEDIVLI